MKKILSFAFGMLALMFFAFPVAAETITVHVGGLVCGLCAQGIQKKFSKIDAIAQFNVNLENQKVVVSTKPKGLVTDAELTKALEDSGFRVMSIERGP